MNTKLSLMMCLLKYLGKSELRSAIYFDVCSLFQMEKGGCYMNKHVTNEYSKTLIVESRWCVCENSLVNTFNMGACMFEIFHSKIIQKYLKDL